MTIERMHGAASVFAADYDRAATTLSPDAVLAYCSSRLSTLDDMIARRFAEQEQKNLVVKEANNLYDIMNNFPAGQTEKVGPYEADHKRMGADLANLWNSTSDPEVRDKCKEFYKTTTGSEMQFVDGRAINTNPDAVPVVRDNVKGFSIDAWKTSVLDSVKKIQDNSSKDSELAMISLQSIISQRQLAVQLTTQIMAAMNEGTKGVVANIRG